MIAWSATPPARNDSGYRQFEPETIERLQFFRQAKQLGFTLREIKELLSLRIDTPTDTTCNEVKRYAQHKLDEVRQRIAALQRIERVLTDLVGRCHELATTDMCPILKSLQDETEHREE